MNDNVKIIFILMQPSNMLDGCRFGQSATFHTMLETEKVEKGLGTIEAKTQNG